MDADRGSNGMPIHKYDPPTQCVGVVVGRFDVTEFTVWAVFDLAARP